MHTFRNLYATSDISFSKKDFWKIIFFCGVWCAIPQAFCALVIDRMIFALGSFPSKSCGSWNRARPETSGDGRRLLDTALICGFKSAYDEAEAVHSCEDSFKERTHRCIFPGGCNNVFRYWILFSTDYFFIKHWRRPSSRSKQFSRPLRLNDVSTICGMWVEKRKSVFYRVILFTFRGALYLGKCGVAVT